LGAPATPFRLPCAPLSAAHTSLQQTPDTHTHSTRHSACVQPNTHATQIWCARCSTSHGQLYNDALLAATPTAAGARALGSVPRPSVLHTVAIARSYISRRAERSRATYVASFSLGRHRSDAGRTSNAGQPTIPPRGLKPRTLTEAHQSSEHSAIIGALRLINHRSTRSSHRRRHRRWPRPWKPLDHTFRHTLLSCLCTAPAHA